MKLYKGMSKRFAKKYLNFRWHKLLWGINLKVGDVVRSCNGFNKRIKNIEWEYVHFHPKGRVVFDAILTFEDESECYLVACCSPKLSYEQIIKDNEFWFSPKGTKIAEDYWGGRTQQMILLRENPESIMDEQGIEKV